MVVSTVIHPDIIFGMSVSFLSGIIFAGLIPWFESHLPNEFYFPVDGLPKWSFYSSMIFQAIFYLLSVYLSWKQANFSWEWFEGNWYTVDRFYDRLVFYLMTFQLSKDLYVIRKVPMLLGHHIFAFVGIIVFYQQPFGAGCLVLSVVILEIGSFFYNLELLYPGGRFLRSYTIMMTFSNIFAAIATSWWCYRAYYYYYNVVSIGNIVFMFVSGHLLAYLRQDVCLKHYQIHANINSIQKKITTKKYSSQK